MNSDEVDILLVDDSPDDIELTLHALRAEGLANHIFIAHDGEEALDFLFCSGPHAGRGFDHPPKLVLLDLKMPKVDGLALLKELQLRAIPTECIIVTGQATVDSAVQAMREGAYDYVEKPLTADKLNHLKALIPKALEKFNVQQKNRELSSKLEGLTHFGELTGQSEEMRAVYQIIEAVAPSSASVLIFGESGTGKELVARAVHAKSERAKGPFFALNCAALPKDILENELFGHEKGAFTGALERRIGCFELAEGGTLLLDEIGEMPIGTQAKLLRVLEDRKLRRLGSKSETTVDVRVLAGTNKSPDEAVARGELRNDLFYRLNVFNIHMPPLRDHKEDIPELVHAILADMNEKHTRTVAGVSDQVILVMQQTANQPVVVVPPRRVDVAQPQPVLVVEQPPPPVGFAVSLRVH